jgi:hypothetical protein
MTGDQPRFLHRDASRNYTFNPAAGVLGEGEALTDEQLDELAIRARRDAHDQLSTEWGKCRDRMLGSLEHFEVNAGSIPGQLRRGVRALRREVSAIDRQLGAG